MVPYRLLKGIHKYFSRFVIFFNVKMDIWTFGNTLTTIAAKWLFTLHYHYNIFCNKNIPRHNLMTELRHEKCKCKKCWKCWDNWLAVLWCTQMRYLVEKVDMLSWTLSYAWFSNTLHHVFTNYNLVHRK